MTGWLYQIKRANRPEVPRLEKFYSNIQAEIEHSALSRLTLWVTEEANTHNLSLDEALEACTI